MKILLVDDEDSQRETLAGFLTKKGYKIQQAQDVDSALKLFKSYHFDLIISDYKMPRKTGEDLVIEVKAINPEIPVVIITAFGEVDDAIRIMKNGAKDYIQKPVDLLNLLDLIIKIENNIVISQENLSLKKKIESDTKVNISSIVYGSDEMDNVLNVVSRVSTSKASVLIRGESGTGKELIAKAIHSGSDRIDQPFIVVNCAALPETLFESELFGHEKGAFTGAVKDRVGKFEQANKGTIFIDEVGDIPLPIQVKLLRTLQFGEIQRLGSEKTQKMDVRVISATNRNLEEMIASGEFREDLFFRLNVVTINLPPLRNRKKDIKPLINFYIEKYSEMYGKNIKGIDSEGMDLMIKYNFPGNIRELENIIQRAVVLTRNSILSINDLPSEVHNARMPEGNSANCDIFELGDLNLKVEFLEKELIKKALTVTDGNQTKASDLLNISERTLRYKISKLELK